MDLGTILAVSQICGELLSLSAKYWLKVNSAKDDIARLCNTLQTFQNILEKFQELTQGSSVNTLSSLDNEMKLCQDDLKKLRDKLTPKKRWRILRFSYHNLKWSFTCDEMQKNISMIQTYIGNFHAALTIDQHSVVVTTGEDIRELKQCQISSTQQQELLQKLSAIENATYNDGHRYEHEPRCLANTRVELLD
ncbi:MAG: hypothetical protein M1834_004877 [Cirrosporium novae-zelandiae]|nr:MAG: hypothetical protein M1834_004877 [Cirrosporium novae-zelandiae]